MLERRQESRQIGAHLRRQAIASLAMCSAQKSMSLSMLV